MVPLAVIDTNVVVAGLLTADPSSPTAQILDDMLRGSRPFALSLALLSEYRGVLLRPKIAACHRLSPEQIDEILTIIAANCSFREVVPPGPEAPDPGDNHLWALLHNVPPPVVLVTGDALLQANPPPGIPVLKPSAYLGMVVSSLR